MFFSFLRRIAYCTLCAVVAISFLHTTGVYAADLAIEVTSEPTVPALNVPIPGLDLKDSIEQTDEVTESTTLGLYVNALYKYLLAAGAVLAVVMVIIGGFQYMTAGGSKKGVTTGKQRINNALIGLVILFAAFTVAYLVDPRTVVFGPFSIPNVNRIEHEEEEDTNISEAVGLSAETTTVSGKSVYMAGTENEIHPDALAALQRATDAFFAATGKHAAVASAKRTNTKQAQLFYDMCLANGGICKPTACNIDRDDVKKDASGKYYLTGHLAGVSMSSRDTIISTMAANGNGALCPHTSGLAIDLWCSEGQSKGYIADPVCQQQLIQAMIREGFCRLGSEAWHFEWPKPGGGYMSSSCSQGNNTITYTSKGKTKTPTADCKRWDFDDHKCIVK